MGENSLVVNFKSCLKVGTESFTGNSYLKSMAYCYCTTLYRLMFLKSEVSFLRRIYFMLVYRII